MTAYYNENDPKAAAWLRELIKGGHIAPGEVDERSIEDVTPAELAGFDQCHFFAGISGWSYALRLAGWPDERPVWTGSCPCQPFSAAGKGAGFADERHLWPAWFHLIRECRPVRIFGEQVAPAIGRKNAYLQTVQDAKTFINVLRGQGTLAEVLQGLQERENEYPPQAGVPRDAGKKARSDLGLSGAIPSEQDGLAVRSGRDGHTASNKRGRVRDDGFGVRSENSQSLEHAVVGSNSARSGLHESERSSGSLLSQRDDEQLGTESNSRDSESDSGEAAGAIEQFVRKNWREFTEDMSWLTLVQRDLGAAGYNFGFSVLAASSVGAPHIRQRLYWMADRDMEGCGLERGAGLLDGQRASFGHDVNGCGADGGMVDPNEPRSQGRGERRYSADQRTPWAPSLVEWIPCADGKSRPTKSGIFPLVAGLPKGMVRSSDIGASVNATAEARVMRLRGYGNSIVPQVAAAFIEACA